MTKQTLIRIAELVGQKLQLDSPERGWPGIATIKLSTRSVLAAMHVGPIGLSHRERDDVERRFQNPGQDRPIATPEEAVPLLVGLWEEGSKPVLVAFDATKRMDKTTRFSLFVPLWLLEKAALTGWAEHRSASDERIVGIHPALLPIYVETLLEDVELSTESIASVLDASGLVEVAAAPEDRARRAALALVRSAVFGKHVLEAYGGTCAACGLNLGLCQAAHIYPVSAPGSRDEVWNGLALCSNHHAAFDRHLLWIEPGLRSVRVHPDVQEHARTSEPSRAFLTSTLPTLRAPTMAVSLPRAEMFAKRYGFYEKCYDWAS